MGMSRRPIVISAAMASLALLVACSSTDSVSAPEPTASPPSTQTAPATEAPSPSTAPAPSTTATTPDTSFTLTCDTESGESPTFEVPLGSEVTLVAKSSIEREFHLHDYDIELTGTEVTFQFTANLPGPHELTEHPDHSVVCTIVS
ncbi:MAG: hypothetical protein RIS41_1750 [Actinomycetota bacterium]|jgi:hypothetical protein